MSKLITSIHDICHFFTLTHFESWKFYTRKVRKFTTYLPKRVIFSFFWNFFTLSQNFYTHGVPGVPDKYQVCGLCGEELEAGASSGFVKQPLVRRLPFFPLYRNASSGQQNCVIFKNFWDISVDSPT